MIIFGIDIATAEVWKEIPDFPDYAVSNLGRVKRTRPGGSNATKPGKILRPGVAGADQRYFNVRLYRDGKAASRTVHRLVLMVFVGPPPSAAHQGAHGDGNPKNNCLENLRWALAAENAADKRAHGTDCRGSRHANASMTDGQVKAIRSIHSRGIGFALLARATGLSPSTLGRLVRGETYR